MNKIQNYCTTLKELQDWDAFLLRESGLPGPRGNLELAHAAGSLISRERIDRYCSLTPDQAPVNSPEEFLVFCGVMGMGRLVSEGDRSVLPRLRAFASDPRWRTREGVATALQTWGAQDMGALLEEMQAWSGGNRLEQRAAAAALCEPALLKQPAQVELVLRILDAITCTVAGAPDRKSDPFKTLRQGLAYCWSVAAAALPAAGKTAMECWLVCTDPDVRWMMKENLKKDRLKRMDAAWVQDWVAKIS
jgi:hypothetical protein